MATFFTNSSNQKDGIPSLYKPEPNFSPNIAVTAVPNSSFYVNIAPGCSYLQSFRNYSDLSIPGRIVLQESSQAGSNTAGNHQKYIMQPAANVLNMGREINSCAESQMNIQNERGTLHIGSSVSSVQGQGLSLSLGTQIPSAIPLQSFNFQHGTDVSFLGSPKSNQGERKERYSHNKQLNNSECSPYSDQVVKGHLLNNFSNSTVIKQMNPQNLNSCGLSGLSSSILNSKYLQAAQQLLQEVVNLRKYLKQDTEKRCSLITFGMDGSKEMDTGRNSSGLRTYAGAASNPQESPLNSANDLSPAERQDLHNKLKKLLSMLDEVDQRYKQYYHQMQIVVSSFDVISGAGAAQPYTALALQTISRHFRCLKDAINGQIRITRKTLGQQDGSNNNETGGISRLRYVDQQFRQQRSLQQMGIIQQHTWRPQRGLPESSVSILRAWLFEHFLHPYPKDSDKIILARQTGLTRGQVSNWFINARVRLWKPMVEEMYEEEIRDVEVDSSSSTCNASKPVEEQRALDDGEDMKSTTREKQQTIAHINNPNSDHYGDDEFPGSNSDIHHITTHEDNAFVNESDQTSTVLGFYQNFHLQGLLYHGEKNPTIGDDGSLLQDEFASSNENPRFMAYQLSELAGTGAGSGDISLTLGLHQCDGRSGMPHQNFVAMRIDESYNVYTDAT